MTAAADWIRERLPRAPAALTEAMIAALPADEDDVPTALATGAVALYGTVTRGGGGRDDALPLLAADALLTHALQAQAEIDPGGVAAFAERWGAAGRLGMLAEELLR